MSNPHLASAWGQAQVWEDDAPAFVRPPWMQEGVCRNHDSDLWFSTVAVEQHEAKRICGTCPVRAECLAHALANGEHHGTWGGYGEKDRRKMRRARVVRALRCECCGSLFEARTTAALYCSRACRNLVNR